MSLLRPQSKSCPQRAAPIIPYTPGCKVFDPFCLTPLPPPLPTPTARTEQASRWGQATTSLVDLCRSSADLCHHLPPLNRSMSRYFSDCRSTVATMDNVVPRVFRHLRRGVGPGHEIKSSTIFYDTTTMLQQKPGKKNISLSSANIQCQADETRSRVPVLSSSSIGCPRWVFDNLTYCTNCSVVKTVIG